MSRGSVATGALAVAAYLAGAGLTSALSVAPVRPVYDGLAPSMPYRYVDPPADLEADNEEPTSAREIVTLNDGGSRARTTATPDGQMLVVVADGSFPPREGERSVVVRITPLDPAPFPPAPEGLEISGNAYRVTAAYEESGDRAPVDEPVTVVLRYPEHATELLRLSGSRWVQLPTEAASASLQVFGESDALGVFVAAGAPQRSRAWIAWVASAVALGAGAAGYLSGRRRTRKTSGPPRRRRGRAPRRRRPG